MSAFTAAARAASGQPLPPWADARPVPAEVLADITALVGLEVEVRTLLPHRLADDDHAVRAERETYAEERIRLSGELSEAVSTETLVRGAELMRQRLDTLQRRRGTQRSQRNLMAHMKGWAITTHAVRQLALEPKLFDLVVIDEASQCSIAAVVPLLFRARRALIIGDPMQLGHIPGISPEQERQARVRAGLTAAWLEDRRFAYHVYSAYHAAAQNGDAALLLDEHYRCRPEIADVVNGHCYASRLEVLTNVRGQVPPVGIGGAGGRGPGRVLAWSDVPNGQSMRGPGDKSWCNPAEAAAVAAVVKELLQELPETATVGVVTPFRAQKDALEREIGGDRVRVGTVHAFQGGQRDVMVLSPVATGNTPPGTAKWVANQVNLWNVAITRAKSQLITVGDHGFWRDQTGLPHVLATRSGLVSGGGAAPVPGSVPGVPRDPDRELLVDRVQQFLGARGVERDAVVGGYPVDLLFAGAEGPVAVLVDTGPIPGRDPARHLRLSQERARLLVGLPFEGRAGAEGVVDVIRVPAWRALAGDEALMPLFD
ncbi:DEAD/DEAH box helicase [Uniformispora flossi]|uniref:DEAD/DEAH box helicase n=1 Tax=Uniformispora flossi TaxID=3390723 RepID=UPI003C2D4AE3